MTATKKNFRLLVIDDNPAIHDDFIKILKKRSSSELDKLSAFLFGDKNEKISLPECEIDFALQGQEGVQLIQDAIKQGQPYALAFVDVRMPPGWDGIETIKHIWEIDKDIQLVICTAYSDYSWKETIAKLGHVDSFLIIKKPFDFETINHLTYTLTKKWYLSKQLQEHIQNLDKANRAKSAFLAAMSHEIRTPLNGVISMTDLVLNTPLTVEQKQCMEIIRVSSETLLNVINDVLDYSKIESGYMKLEKENVSIKNLIQDAINIISTQAHEKHIDISVNIDPNIPNTLNGDPLRIKQILFNLLSNAVKFTEKGTINIHAKVLKRDLAKNKQDEASYVTLLFEVIDSGIGMTDEVRTSLFQMFYQGDLSITRKYGGTGLGLAICKRLVNLMGGAIDAESVPGNGSKFWFTVQLTEPRLSTTHKNKEVQPSTTSIPVESLKNRHILVVEDNPINQQVVTRVLAKLGHHADIAENGLQALEAFKHEQYDLILMDCGLPEMDGYTATKEIRKLELKKQKHLPIIGMTAHALQGDREKCLSSGMDDYIAKPFNLNTFENILEKWLRQTIKLDSTHF